MKAWSFIKRELYIVQRVRNRHDIQWQCNWRAWKREKTACDAAQSETVTHLESFPVMKQDIERLCFNGEGERETEMKAADRCLSLLQAELMPTCCTQMASICIDVCVCKREGSGCVFQSALPLCSRSMAAECWRSRLLLKVLTGRRPSRMRIFFFYQALLL